VPHGFVYIELNVEREDFAAASTFYRTLFGWGIDVLAKGEHPYAAFDADTGIGGGLATPGLPARAARAQWVPYVRVDDVHEAARRAEGLGARIIRAPVTIPYKGALVVIADPAGAIIGLWQPFAPAEQESSTP
jgi:predicted enzyme related to lactoylglutathione lyase